MCCDVMVIIIGNGYSDTSSNLGAIGKGMNASSFG